MPLELTIEASALQRALLASPRALERHLDRAIGRVTQEIARDARIKAPKAFSTLTNSIRGFRPSTSEGIVAPGVDYARLVEEGTEGGGDRLPPTRNLLDWVKVKGISPNDPDMTQEDLAFAIARSIAVKGTPAQPYLRPALEENRARAERLISRAIDDALREAGG